ncbi:MAG: hypothetical protein IK990_04595 [Ruminiclostridium sp.]|nr:hypothetical protein [Ruminiclostridium sp.]
MWEIAALCAAAVFMAALYRRTEHPKLCAFFNITAGALSLAVSEIMLEGSLTAITPYNAALSVILGIPGTIAHRLLMMM